MPVDVNTLPAVPGEVNPVPPAAAGSVPAVKVDEDVEYKALLVPLKLVKPVPPYAGWIVPPCHVPPETIAVLN